MAQQPAAPVAGGIVFKKGKTGGVWKERWCIMKSQYFVYYKSENDSDPQGMFDVTDSKCTAVSNTGKGKWKFQVEDRTGRLWDLYVLDEKARNQWVNGIRKIATGVLLQGQQTMDDANSNSPSQRANNNSPTESETVNSGEEEKSDDDNKSAFSGMSKKFGKMIGGDDKSKSKQKMNKNLGAPSKTGFTRTQSSKLPTYNDTNQQSNQVIKDIPTVSPYLIKELTSPPVRSSSVFGPKLKFEESEIQRNQLALKKGMERKNTGKEEIDSDEDDLLPEPKEGLSDCKQQ